MHVHVHVSKCVHARVWTCVPTHMHGDYKERFNRLEKGPTHRQLPSHIVMACIVMAKLVMAGLVAAVLTEDSAAPPTSQIRLLWSE